jgi:hypothetical protein
MKQYYITYQRGRSNFRTLPVYKSHEEVLEAISSKDFFVGCHITDFVCMEVSPVRAALLALYQQLDAAPPFLAPVAGWLMPRITNLIMANEPMPDHEIKPRPSDIQEVNPTEFLD